MPEFHIPESRAKAAQRRKLSKVLAFVKRAQSIRLNTGCTIMPIPTTNKNMIAIAGSVANVSNLIMTLDGLFKLLLLDADVPLRDCGGAVLQELLDKDDIVAVVIVNLCCVELAEAVRADILAVPQVGANAL